MYRRKSKSPVFYHFQSVTANGVSDMAIFSGRVMLQKSITWLSLRLSLFQMKLIEAIKLVGKNGGYVYIMDIATGIPYISETLSKDVTNEVKTQLNSMK